MEDTPPLLLPATVAATLPAATEELPTEDTPRPAMEVTAAATVDTESRSCTRTLPRPLLPSAALTCSSDVLPALPMCRASQSMVATEDTAPDTVDRTVDTELLRPATDMPRTKNRP